MSFAASLAIAAISISLLRGSPAIDAANPIRIQQDAIRYYDQRGEHFLRDLGAADLPALEAALDPVLLRRARHVVTENARVDA